MCRCLRHLLPGAPAFVNYAAPDNIPPSVGSTDASQHVAGEPSIGVDWNTGKLLAPEIAHFLEQHVRRVYQAKEALSLKPSEACIAKLPALRPVIALSEIDV
ncbi:MAG: hypothetical protein WCG81_09635 [Candidatus Angelobacter sp.]